MNNLYVFEFKGGGSYTVLKPKLSDAVRNLLMFYNVEPEVCDITCVCPETKWVKISNSTKWIIKSVDLEAVEYHEEGQLVIKRQPIESFLARFTPNKY
ncbi:hypothetical protein Molly5_140 [Maribacter phage Molly_5]|nr:hypothetical protein Molly4_140 [Maribacter phage Molly_4]QQO98234.1 hypothetical protein Molly5_140 [Maribacter phage Molly_5]